MVEISEFVATFFIDVTVNSSVVKTQRLVSTALELTVVFTFITFLVKSLFKIIISRHVDLTVI
jgi:hypothetical protein